MSDSLAKLLASPEATRPARTVPVCLAQGVPVQIGRLVDELEDLEVAAFRASQDPEASSDQPKRKMAQGQDPRIDEIKAEVERLNEVMRAHTGYVTVEGTISQGEWRLWADQNPAREIGRDDRGRPNLNAYDISVTGGYCSATALLARVGDFVTKWDGEPLSEGQWEALAAKAHPGDLKAVATAVVNIYEGEGARALPKSSTASSMNPGTETS